MEPSAFEQMAATQGTHWWYAARRIILKSFIQRMRLPPAPRILEIGCGTGANLLMLKKYGTVSGIEPCDFARQHAIAFSGCNITEGYLPNDLRVAGKFDFIGAFDVIEHIDDDLGSLQAIRGLLEKGGIALLTVPAYPFLWSQHDIDNHHKRRYTRPQFRALLEAAGFEVTSISYYNTVLFPLIALIRLVKNALKITDTSDSGQPAIPFVNTLLRYIFGAERHVLKHISLPFGVSIIAQCRNPPC